MNRVETAPRRVIGYHGCRLADAEKIVASGSFTVSANAYDWLGRGVYFWEYAPHRARLWAEARCGPDDEPAVIRATILLSNCLNLLDVGHFEGLRWTYRELASAVDSVSLPRNTDTGGHFLDRLVIDAYCRSQALVAAEVQTVRGSFAEGEPIYAGSKILNLAHTQVAVRDLSCIGGISLVDF